MLSISKAAEVLGVSPGTLRRWDAEGRIQVSRSVTGYRQFDVQQIQRDQFKRQVLLYSRVCSRKQSDDLQRQSKYLRDNLPTAINSMQINEIQDIGSGLNFKRKGLITLLEAVTTKSVHTVVVASRDRLCRFGFELLEWLCKQNNTNILVLNNKDSTPEQELGEDLLSIVQVYCCRWNGRRRYIGKNKMLEVTTTSISTPEETSESVGTHVSLHLQCNNSHVEKPKHSRAIKT
jgi:putative resolvase